MGLSLGQEDRVYLDYISKHAKKSQKIVVYVRKRIDIKKIDRILRDKFPSFKISYKIWARAYEWIYKIRMFTRSLKERYLLKTARIANAGITHWRSLFDILQLLTRITNQIFHVYLGHCILYHFLESLFVIFFQHWL